MTAQIKHHLDPATLMAYSAGSLGEALSAIAAAHIEMCPQCAAEMCDLDLMGALLLTSIAGANDNPMRSAPARPAGDVVPLNPRRQQVVSPASEIVRPAAIGRKYGVDFSNVPWRRLGPGTWHYKLPLSEGSKGDLRLLKIAAGRRMPEHGHGGTELTLVLDGAYSDENGTYSAGDVQDIDGDTEHRPVAAPHTGCICIVASERPAKFKGLVNKLLQPLTGM